MTHIPGTGVVNLPVKQMIHFLIAVCFVLALANIGAHYWASLVTNKATEVAVTYFALDAEANFPTYFSALLLLSSAATFALIGRGALQVDSQWKTRHWTILAFVFAFLSWDEAIQFHDKLDSQYLLGSLGTTGFLAWPWVFVYGTFVLVFASFFVRFWLALPFSYRWRYAVAGVMYVGGALGLEMVGASIYTSGGHDGVGYLVVSSIEEILEMLAIILVLHTNMQFLSLELPDVHFDFKDDSNRTPPQKIRADSSLEAGTQKQITTTPQTS